MMLRVRKKKINKQNEKGEREDGKLFRGFAPLQVVNDMGKARSQHVAKALSNKATPVIQII